MNKEDVLKLAREAHGAMLESGRGMYLWHGDAYAGDVQDFCERFAALVAAAERERIIAANAPEIERVNAHIKALEDAVTDEREACAQLLDDMAARDKLSNYYAIAAKAIRARGQA